MGWLGEVLKVLFGLDEEQRAWRDQVAAAEHHLRWGAESRTARDFERVLETLAQCPASDPPAAGYLHRREHAAAEAHRWLARLALDGIRDQAAKSAERFQAREEGRRSLLAQIGAARERVRQLEADGSLISAREERRRLEEMERQARELPDLAAEKRAGHAAVFGRLAPVFAEHRREAGSRLVAWRAVAGLVAEDQAARDELAREFEAALAALDADWKALSAAAPPPPAGGRGQ
jgi:hypothetical protein